MTVSTNAVAVIEGASSGVGRSLAHLFARQGWRLVLVARRADELTRVAQQTGGIAVVGDITHAATHAAALDAAIQSFGRVDSLIVAAGVGSKGGVRTMTLEAWNDVLRINLTGPFLAVQTFAPQLMQARGSIVLVSSVSGLLGGDSVGYSVSKAGLNQLARSIAVELGPFGVRANAVCPGWIRTELSDRGLQNWADQRGLSLDEAYAATARHIPAGRAATAEEIASVIAFLASPASAYVNGTCVTADGGGLAVDVGMIGLH